MPSSELHPAEPDDRVLLRRFQDGDAAALRIFLDRYADGLALYMGALLRDRQAGFDALHDLVILLARKIGSFTAAENVRKYLFAAAANVAMERRRAETREQRAKTALRDESPLVTPSDPARAAAGAEEARRVSRALVGLPEADREVVILHVYEEFTFQDIADMTGKPLSTVHLHYQAALQKLRASITGGK